MVIEIFKTRRRHVQPPSQPSKLFKEKELLTTTTTSLATRRAENETFPNQMSTTWPSAQLMYIYDTF